MVGVRGTVKKIEKKYYNLKNNKCISIDVYLLPPNIKDPLVSRRIKLLVALVCKFSLYLVSFSLKGLSGGKLPMSYWVIVSFIVMDILLIGSWSACNVT